MGVRRLTIPELTVEGKRLGRHIEHDERSHDFAAEAAPVLVSVRHKTAGLPLDQVDVGSCTTEATTGACNTAPNHKPRGKVRHQKDAYHLYSVETKNEGQPWPPNDPGGTGLAACKAAKQLGWISSYTHAFGIEHALLTLVTRPVITGVSWFSSFDNPNSDGLVSIASGANVRGGHEIEASELIVPKGATIDDLGDILVGLEQSWGKGWGLGGRFYWTAATWKELLDQQGDVTVPVV